MNTEEKKTFSPKLRFPEFRGAEEWSNQQLGNVAKFFKGKGLPKSALTLNGKRPCIHYGELFTFYSEVIDVVRSRTNSEDDLFLSVKNDVLMPTSDVTPSGLAKACCLNSEGVILGGDILVIRTDKDSVNGEFLARQIRHLEHKVLQLVSGSTVFHLYASSMEKLALSFPSKFAEQQKIADCLSSLDELIAVQARIVEALKAHKKGLMQQLFPREGETQPRLRFPEFQNTGDWVEQSVGDFGKVVTGNTPSTAQPAFYGGGIPFASPADISDLRFVDQTKTTLTPEGFAVTRPIRAGSVLFVCIGSTIGKVAQNVRDCATNQQINSVVPSSKHSDNFVYFALSHASERIALLAGRQAVPIINKSLFSSVQLLVPKFAEQKRIADCLTTLDDLIAAAIQGFDTLKTHKKGLMQQLFPSRRDD